MGGCRGWNSHRAQASEPQQPSHLKSCDALPRSAEAQTGTAGEHARGRGRALPPWPPGKERPTAWPGGIRPLLGSTRRGAWRTGKLPAGVAGTGIGQGPLQGLCRARPGALPRPRQPGYDLPRAVVALVTGLPTAAHTAPVSPPGPPEALPSPPCPAEAARLWKHLRPTPCPRPARAPRGFPCFDSFQKSFGRIQPGGPLFIRKEASSGRRAAHGCTACCVLGGVWLGDAASGLPGVLRGHRGACRGAGPPEAAGFWEEAPTGGWGVQL